MRDEDVTELKTKALRVRETQEFIKEDWVRPGLDSVTAPTNVYPVPMPSAPGNSVPVARIRSHIEAPSAHVPGATPHEQVLLCDRK